MVRGLLFWLVWLGFVIYAFVFAPPDRPDTALLIQNLIRGETAGINPTIVALFNLMGVYPLIYACILCSDGHGQKVPAWLFVLLSMGVGAFALLPYFALRQPNPKFVGQKNWFIKLTDSRITGLIIAVATIVLLIYGYKYGDWIDFLDQWESNRFIHVMTLDFIMLTLLFPWILGDDMARRGLDRNSFLYFLIATIPLIGPVAYLTCRPNLITQEN
jgi:hypothetical protein